MDRADAPRADEARRNLRTAIVLLSIAAIFFVGIMIRYKYFS